MIAHNYRQRPGFANLIDDLREPDAACVRVFDAPHLLAGINHQSVRDVYRAPHPGAVQRASSGSPTLDS